MAGHRLDRASAERWLSLRARLGLTFRELSERSGIPEGTLGWWSSRLRREGHGFAEVVVEDEQEEESLGRVVLIRLRSGRQVEVPEDVDSSALQRIVEALESC